MTTKSQIESLLFIAAKPMAIKDLADLLKKSVEDVARAGVELVAEYQSEDRGIRLIQEGKRLQMVSSPENATVVQEFIKDETMSELSRPSLETLTIIAYRGPVSKLDLDRIRGINCSLILRNLLIRGLIESKMDKRKGETYSTITLDFIKYLGVQDLHELPDYERLSQDDTLDRMLKSQEAELKSVTPATGKAKAKT